MTTKVNKITKFINYFTSSGRSANELYKNISLKKGEELYQRHFANGSLGVLKTSIKDGLKEDRFYMLNPDGSHSEKHSMVLRTLKPHLLKRFMVNRTDYGKFGEFIASRRLQKAFNTFSGKLEEKAERIQNWKDGIIIKVLSKKNRETTFPSTKIGGKLHPAIYTKKVLQNGDVVFTEKYLYP